MLIVNGTTQGFIAISENQDGTAGSRVFASPNANNLASALLSFEVVGATIEIRDGRTTLFSGVLVNP